MPRFLTPARLRTGDPPISRPSASEDRPSPPAPGLITRFSLYAALALLLAGTGLFLFVRANAITSAEQQALAHTRFVARSILPSSLRPRDLQRPEAQIRRRQLDSLFRAEVLVGGALRVKLYAPDGTVRYSNDPSVIGTRSADTHDIRRAAGGHSISDVSNLNGEGGSGPDRKVLETYVPVSLGSGPAAGVFELYQDYAPISQEARRNFMPLAIVVTLALLGLYAAFFPILRGAARRLRRQMRDIEHHALHDALTDLPNRMLFQDRVAQALLSAQRRGEHVAIMLIDLDRFKDVNDTLGHQSGDELLRCVAERMGAALRASDTVARLGGDEFAVLAPNVGGPEGALAVARKLRDALLEHHEVAGLELEVDASIGITLYPEDGEDVNLLLQRADVAMYISKERHEPTCYSSEHDHHSETRLTLMSQLRRAIVGGELVVHYQPQADLRSGLIHSAEALVRWQHPEHGLLPPDSFIPLAEHAGLIRPLTFYVLNCALKQCRAWRDEGLDLSVAVNITGRDLLDLLLPAEVEGLLRRWDVPADHLELEITENTVLSDPVRSRNILVALNELGVRLAIDDYGSGNSSLGYLKRLPVSVLKIDKSFVMSMQTDPDDAIIVRSTIDLGHNLGLSVVAEGVEDVESWDTLDRLGCDTVQGYYLARPGPPESISTLVRERGGASRSSLALR